jgi:hypothetical protein
MTDVDSVFVKFDDDDDDDDDDVGGGGVRKIVIS